MIWHVIDRDQLLPLSRDDTGDVLLKLIVVLFLNKALPPLYGENDMDVDLRVGVSHGAAPTELIAIFIGGTIQILLLRSIRYTADDSNHRGRKQKVAPVRKTLLDLPNVQTADPLRGEETVLNSPSLAPTESALKMQLFWAKERSESGDLFDGQIF
jgi:hypothetical protein